MRRRRSIHRGEETLREGGPHGELRTEFDQATAEWAAGPESMEMAGCSSGAVEAHSERSSVPALIEIRLLALSERRSTRWDAGCDGTGNGALLTASGEASVTSDSMALTCDGVINGSGVFFQGDHTIGGGTGASFGDGLRCCGGFGVRIQFVDPPGSASPATAQMTETATTNGPAVTVLPGSSKCYQYLYRDPFTSPCGTSFNLSNAIRVDWLP